MVSRLFGVMTSREGWNAATTETLVVQPTHCEPYRNAKLQ